MKKIATVINQSKDERVIVMFDEEYEEYACKLFIGNEHYKPADYHTSDRDDAMDTAKAMLSN